MEQELKGKNRDAEAVLLASRFPLPASELIERQAVIAEALTWLNTPYHHGQAVKGAGVDCALFLSEVYHAAGMIPKIEFEYYPHDWHVHRNDERYLRHIMSYGVRILPLRGPLPGDVAMYKFGRCTAHGAIVVEWPHIIHSLLNVGVIYGEAHAPALVEAFRGFYRLKRWV